jgi:uncharacterized repeat protein (TIGR03803 family)
VCRYGCGTAFELSPAAGGRWTGVLHNFSKNIDDGHYPNAGLIFDASGNLYGVTLVGGLNGQGTVFELTATATGSWTETVLHDFSSQSTDGANPNAGLIFGVSGNLYGTTGQGGSSNEGPMFEIKPSAWRT